MKHAKKVQQALRELPQNFKQLKNLDYKNFPFDDNPNPRQCANCGVGMTEGYYVLDDFYSCSQDCMVQDLYDRDIYYWTTWEDDILVELEAGEPCYDSKGNAYYLTKHLEAL